MSNSSDLSVFIVLVGGYGNVGDAVIRRRALEVFRGEGTIHAYVGNAPQSWIEQLGLSADGDRIYKSGEASGWAASLIRTRRPKVLVFDPGEVNLRSRQAPKELGFLLLTLAARLTGATVVRMPRAVREPATIPKLIHGLACRASNLVLWRERESALTMKVGRLSPDIGFSEERVAVAAPGSRRLTVSIRGPRTLPADGWFEAIARFAREQDLTVTCVSQVREDEERTRALHARFVGSEYIAWGDRTDAEQENVARAVYRESKLVVSDRLHVLVLAALDHAGVAELIPRPSGKIARHFDVIGVAPVSADSSTLTETQIVDFLRRRVDSRPDVESSIEKGRAALQRHLADARRVASAV